MISTSTFAFVLALGAVVAVGLLWITSLRQQAELERWRSTTGSALRSYVAKSVDAEKRTSALLRELESKTPASLAAEVAELSAAVARLAATQRRFAGKFHAERQHAPVSNGDASEVDDEIAAHLALQTAPPARPGA